MSNLLIYRASAGSGKTYKITEEYIRLLFQYENNYRHILAVTFTHKATAEMKERIISKLYDLSLNLPTGYESQLMDEFELSSIQVQQKAQRILNFILHDFSRFSVTTIDSFFQRILQSFIHEVGLQFGYNIELDNNKVLNEAISRLWLDIDENSSLKEWLVQYAVHNIELGNTWDLKKALGKLGKLIFTEKYQQFDIGLIKSFSDKSFLYKYIGDIKKTITDFENNLAVFGEKGLKIIENHSLEVSDFSYGNTGVAGYFQKLAEKKTDKYDPGSRVTDALDDVHKWYKKDSLFKHEILNAVENGLWETLNSAVEFYNHNCQRYYTSKQIIQHIHTLGLLTDISKKIRDYTFDENLFLLSDAGKILMEVIRDNPVPFIYEKSGSYLRHFMIDEFQDTSEIQYNNFKPLISDSLSENNKCVLVGDVKQSIYRWRNSEWKILATDVENDFNSFGIDVKSLDYNYRSRKNIIYFNNLLFISIANLLQDNFNSMMHLADLHNKEWEVLIKNAYCDVKQNIPDKAADGGMVYLRFFKNEKEKSWKQQALEKTLITLNRLTDKGLQAKDIVILVRTKSDGEEIADFLLKQRNLQFNIISEEALYISSSLSIQFLIACLKFINNQHDLIHKTFIHFFIHSYFTNKELTDFTLINEYNEEVYKIILSYNSYPLYDIVNELIKKFDLISFTGQQIYLVAFLDLVYSYGIKNSSDINRFIEWWDEEGVTKALPVNRNVDAIRILTLHKSKGLQFKAVLVPFCDWKIDHDSSKDNFLWCSPTLSPFDKIKLLPVKYYKALEKTIFATDYLQEKLKAYVDNLNLLYVAFTRSEDILIAFGEEKTKDSLTNVFDLIQTVFKKQNNSGNSDIEKKELNNFFNSYNSDKMHFLLGEIIEYSTDDKKENGFEGFDIKKPLMPFHNRLLIKYNVSNYFNDENYEQLEKLNYGKLMHEIFEKIKTPNDLQVTLNEFIAQGKITRDDSLVLFEKISELFKNKTVKEWFGKDWEYKTEASILLKDGTLIRPDRVLTKDDKAVIIDYKFGSVKDDKHIIQIKNYKEQLYKMNFTEIKGYIWYVDLNIITEV